MWHNTVMQAPFSPGPVLKSFRVARRLSQEELAHRAAISPRHLSCLETGKAFPSHGMVLRLGAALDLPLRDRNTLLVASGFTPAFRASTLGDPALAHVEQAIARILESHEPHPAVLLDRAWNGLRLNGGALRLFGWLGLAAPPNAHNGAGAGSAPVNLNRALFDPQMGLRTKIVNFDAVADATLERLRAEAELDPTLAPLLAELDTLRGPRAESGRTENLPVALPIHIAHGGVTLHYFTTLTTLGTPLDVTAQDLRIECFYPMDAATEAFSRRLAAGGR